MKRRFYRATLPTIVWNPETDKPLAEFVDGQYYTESEEIANKLIAMGYPEVSLDATEPPEIIPAPVPIETPDAKPAKTEEQALTLDKQQRAAVSPSSANDAQGEEPPKVKRVLKRRKK